MTLCQLIENSTYWWRIFYLKLLHYLFLMSHVWWALLITVALNGLTELTVVKVIERGHDIVVCSGLCELSAKQNLTLCVHQILKLIFAVHQASLWISLPVGKTLVTYNVLWYSSWTASCIPFVCHTRIHTIGISGTHCWSSSNHGEPVHSGRRKSYAQCPWYSQQSRYTENPREYQDAKSLLLASEPLDTILHYLDGDTRQVTLSGPLRRLQ